MGTENVERWVKQLSGISLPILPQSIERIRELKAQGDDVRPRDVSRAVLHDPMLTLAVLRFFRMHRTERMLTDITTVEHAIMMLGVNPFFKVFSELQPIDHLLGRDKAAMKGIMAVVGRARHAAMLATQWALLRNDIESDEVIIAALLHDMAEILLWCFAPRLVEQVERQLESHPHLRSSDVQLNVLGFPFNELELALVKAWDLPTLLTSLVDDYRADHPRARNVILAVNLARHAAHGWGDPAIPDDLLAVQRLIGGSSNAVRQRVYSASLDFVRDHAWYGENAPAVWLPPFPLPLDVDAAIGRGPQVSPNTLNFVRRLLDSDLENGFWESTKALRTNLEGKVRLPGLIALIMHGLYKGAGFSRCAYFAIDRTGRVRAQYLRGTSASGSLGAESLPLPDDVFLPSGLLGGESAVWWRGVVDSVDFGMLPAGWRQIVSPAGFVLARVSSASGDGIIYADTHGADVLHESQFAAFQELCGFLQARLDQSKGLK